MIPRRWRNSWSARALAISLAALSAAPAAARDLIPACDPEKPTHCSVDLEQGEVAPFSGQLLTPDLAFELGWRAQSFEKRLKAELDLKLGIMKIDLELARKLHQVDLKACDASKQVLTQALEEASSRPFYEHPAFVATITVVLTLFLVWVVRETKIIDPT